MKIKDLPKIERPRETLIKKRLDKKCLCCGRDIRVLIYSKNDYRGGHFFGKLPLKTKAEAEKPNAFVEYWECPKCYWSAIICYKTGETPKWHWGPPKK